MQFGSLIYIVILVVAFYLLIIRPQQQRARQMRELMAALSIGDRIITIGGMHGTVVSLGDQTVRLRVTDNSEIEFEKSAIAKITMDIPELTDSSVDSASVEAGTGDES